MKRKWFALVFIFAILAMNLGLHRSIASAQTTYVNYVVQPGDTLGKIAAKYCTTWNAIYNINRDTIGSNPNVIQPGMVLTVPANCGTSTTPPASGVYDRGPMTHATGTYTAPYYTVAWGDTLSGIGMRFGVPWQDIATANGIQGTLIFAGQALIIPDGSTSIVPPAQGPAERINFQSGTISASTVGVISQGVPKSYILWGQTGQTMTINTVSHGEALVITVTNAKGEMLPLTGTNNQVYNNVSARLPSSGDYIVTVRPLSLPESPSLTFDITFIIQ